MTTGIVQDQNLEKHIEKQMGCMAGFLQIFDRHQILAGKRVYSTKRLPPSVLVSLFNYSFGFPSVQYGPLGRYRKMVVPIFFHPFWLFSHFFDWV